MDGDASLFREGASPDERGRLVSLPRLGFYGPFPRVDPLSQNGCACGETCPVGAHESRAEIGSASEEDQPQDSLTKASLHSAKTLTPTFHPERSQGGVREIVINCESVRALSAPDRSVTGN